MLRRLRMRALRMRFGRPGRGLVRCRKRRHPLRVLLRRRLHHMMLNRSRWLWPLLDPLLFHESGMLLGRGA